MADLAHRMIQHEVEREVLGLILLGEGGATTLFSDLFTEPKHQIIFNAMYEMTFQGEEINAENLFKRIEGSLIVRDAEELNNYLTDGLERFSEFYKLTVMLREADENRVKA
jgi:replicative DNA helicase